MYIITIIKHCLETTPSFLLTYFSFVNVYIFVNRGVSLSNATIW